MTFHSHGREPTPPEIFTDDEAAAPPTHAAAAPIFATAPVDTPADSVLEDEEELTQTSTPRLAADPWADVHPEPIVIPQKTGVQAPAESPVKLSGKPRTIKPLREKPEVLVAPAASAEEATVATDPDPTAPDRGGGWTIPMLCAGLAVIAACILVPLAEENHQLVYQRERLKLDLAQVQKQVAVNDEFLKRIADDPALAERLAQRQMKTIRRGEAVLDLPSRGHEEMSPFMLVTVAPPTAMPPYRPVGGMLAAATRSPQTRLFLMGGGLFLVMFGLVLGHSKD